MGAVIDVGGVPKGTNIGEYTVNESATPINPDDSGPGFGQVSFTTNDWPTSKWMLGQEIALRDGIRGRFGGVVRAVESSHNDLAGFSADSVFSKFNVVRKALPMTAMLSEVLDYYLELCEIVMPVDFLAVDHRISVPSFVGNVWENIKKFASAYQIEIAVVGDRIVVRELGTHEAFLDRATSYSSSAETMTAARTVQVNYYNHHPIEDGEVYPIPEDEDGEPQIFQVEAGETVVYEIDLSASLVSVNQPVQQYISGPGDASGTQGRYSVVGADDLPITVAQWTEGGGDVNAEIDPEDPSRLLIKVTGAKWPHLAPYRIAASAGGTDYNSLHITGDGVARIKRTALLYTGADPSVVMDDVGAEVDNPYITSLPQALNTGFHTAAAYNGSQVSISTTVVDPHRRSASQDIVETTLQDLDDYHGEVSQWHPVPLYNSHGEYGLEGWDYAVEDESLVAAIVGANLPEGALSWAYSTGAVMTYELPEQPPATQARITLWYLGVSAEINGEAVPDAAASPAQITIDVSGDAALVVSGTFVGVTALEYEVLSPAEDLADFDNIWANYETLNDFSMFWEGRFLNQFENQLFGNVAGAIITIPREAKYRVNEVTVDTGVVSMSATPYTRLIDFDAAWAGKSMDDFDGAWINATLNEISLTPLWYNGESD